MKWFPVIGFVDRNAAEVERHTNSYFHNVPSIFSSALLIVGVFFLFRGGKNDWHISVTTMELNTMHKCDLVASGGVVADWSHLNRPTLTLPSGGPRKREKSERHALVCLL